MSLGDITVDQTGDTNSDAQFSVEAGMFADEDLPVELDAVTSTTGLRVYYYDGASGLLRSDANAGYSILTAASGRAYYNE